MRNEAQQQKQQPQKQNITRILLIAGIVIAALVLIAVIVIGVKGNTEQPEEEFVEESIYGDEYLGIDPRVDEELEDYRNVILFGIDGEGAEDSPTLSDDLIIVSFDKNTEEMKMLSLDGDAYMDIEDGFERVTAAYEKGGMDKMIKTINRNMDLNVREGVALPWTMIEELVDKIGGIEVGLPDGTTQTMNGQQAVAYARSGSADSADKSPMQTVLMAALAKAKTMETDKAVSILDEVMPQVIQRSMNRDQVSALLLDMSVKEPAANILWPYDTLAAAAGTTPGSTIPNTLQSNVMRLHAELFRQTDYDPTDTVKQISSSIAEQQYSPTQ